MFHICDGNLNNEIDEHLNISEGQYDFKKILELIKEHDQNNINKPISPETPKHISLDNDINNINKIKKFLISS